MTEPPADPITTLQLHLTERYGITIDAVLDWAPDVYVLRRRDGPTWVARVFPSTRPLEAVVGDVAVLKWLAARGYPAERVAAEDPVSVLDGRPVMVTEWVQGVARARRRAAIKDAGGIRGLGELLARLHTLPADGPQHRPGGAWHHIADGPPSAELAAAGEWLSAAQAAGSARELAHFGALQDALEEIDACEGLPQALLHPDFVLANVVATEKPEMVLVDWAGAGRGPRLWTLAFLLWAEGAKDLRRVELALSGYRRHIELQQDELARLARVIAARPLVFDIWRLHHGTLSPAAAAASAAQSRALACRIAERAIACC